MRKDCLPRPRGCVSRPQSTSRATLNATNYRTRNAPSRCSNNSPTPIYTCVRCHQPGDDRLDDTSLIAVLDDRPGTAATRRTNLAHRVHYACGTTAVISAREAHTVVAENIATPERSSVDAWRAAWLPTTASNARTLGLLIKGSSASRSMTYPVGRTSRRRQLTPTTTPTRIRFIGHTRTRRCLAYGQVSAVLPSGKRRAHMLRAAYRNALY